MANALLQRYEQLGELFDPSTITIKSALRVNTSKIEEEKLISRLKEKGVTLEKIPFIENGYWYESNFSLSSTVEYLSGYFYLQETASQLPALALLAGHSFFKGKKILDMCAAPGSKTTQLAALTNNEAVITAMDSHDARLKVVRSNCERQGAKNVVCIRKEAEYIKDIKSTFDFILLDAPCSGNFCVEKNFFEERTVYDITSRVPTQKKLFEAAHKVLKKGGVLVYSTCSLEPEENEFVVEWALQTFNDIYLEEIPITIGDTGKTNVFGKELHQSIQKTKRFWPHKTNTEGFFIAKFKKSINL